MSSVIEQKKQIVSDLADKFRNSKSAVVVDYRGLDVAEVTELRTQLREAGVDFKVYKNTMVRRAADEVELSELNEVLQGPTAVAFHEDDAVAAAKVLNNFAKDHDSLEIKGGVVEGQVATLEQIKELANLPNYEGLVSMFLSVLQAPIRNFAYATKAIADQKEEESA
ncbi:MULTISPECIES: 50S ribosomal protein L10 [Halobacillus]|uniref:Large ribosomal subunit protein uL10 n=4 Tax=Halobacillus TaxID=45667 RepID=A0A1H0U6K1_HALAD|nr:MULTISPECIES: 50S ribosomal protein L10 [Halobacillus]MBX0359865.1 50S ribosomal protein L10 [Halobacillus sp. Nhm2S1]REJ07056.1 50S ribosomal protein L10 [Halobacillus trueperi]GEN55196.1 50S ribosomal protein L10 [Halobacillus faecis]SDP61615.1 large subunit ribosomal protein L10 [Halobacillus aidingensis]